MNFEFTEEQLMIRDAARDFAQRELLPGVIERDEKAIYPTEQVKSLENLVFWGCLWDLIMMEEEWIPFLTFWQWKKFLKSILRFQ